MELWEALTLLIVGMWAGVLVIGGYMEMSRDAEPGHKGRTLR